MSLVRLYLLSGLLHAYVGLRLLPGLPGGLPAGTAVAVLLWVNAGLMPMALLARRIADRPRADRYAWGGALAMGFFSWLLVLTVLRDVSLLVGAGLAWFEPAAAAALGRWRSASAAGVPLLAVLATAVGFVNARRTAPVVTVDVPIDGLPTALHGFTIAQISDIHVGPTIKQRYLGRIVASVNRIGADMVAVTGDLVDGSVPELSAQVGPLAGLTSRHGTFFVTGNHEYYSGAASWVRELLASG